MNLTETSLWIGTFLKKRLESVVPVYPVMASEGAPLSFCVYRRVGFQAASTKDGVYSDTLNVLFSIVAPTQTESLRIASEVINRLDGLRGKWEDCLIESIRLADASERFDGNSFVQELYFSITLDN